MFVAVTPQNFRVYGSFGYGDIIFNDLKLPATKGTDLKQTMAQVSLEGLVAFQPDQMFIVNFGGEADKVYEDYKNSAVWKDNKAVKNNHVYEVSNEVFNTKAFNPIGKDMLIDEIAKEILAKTNKKKQLTMSCFFTLNCVLLHFSIVFTKPSFDLIRMPRFNFARS